MQCLLLPPTTKGVFLSKFMWSKDREDKDKFFPKYFKVNVSFILKNQVSKYALSKHGLRTSCLYTLALQLNLGCYPWRNCAPNALFLTFETTFVGLFETMKHRFTCITTNKPPCWKAWEPSLQLRFFRCPCMSLQGGKTFCASICAPLSQAQGGFFCVLTGFVCCWSWVKCTRCERLLPVKHFYLTCLLFFRRLKITLDSEQPTLKEKRIIPSVWGGIKGFEHFLRGEYFSDCASD